jgi:hydroxymethylbilane synthase
MADKQRLRLGTRASALARWQADWVSAQLQALGIEVELVLITTSGDAQQIGPIGNIGGSGVFTKEIQRALLDNRVDLAVHSLKDLPTEPVEGLVLAAVPERESTRDALISPQAMSIGHLKQGAVVGTGSLRRQAQLLHARPDLELRDIRGNVDTRLRKLDEGEFDAIVLAEAGLRRLQLAHRITELVPQEIMLPAIGQGALGIEARTEDNTTRVMLAPLDNEITHAAVLAERALLAHLRGGCMAPVGGWGRMEDGQLRLSGVVLSGDGSQRLLAEDTASPADAAALGVRVAEQLLSQGAAALISASRAR